MSRSFTRRGWLLFAVMALLWGVPYLFISAAVQSISPAAVVAGRTLLGALLLLPFALRAGALRPALRVWPWVLAFAGIEMAGPFLLLGIAEQEIPSGLTGLLVATVPLFATLIAVFGGDRSALRPLRVVGLLLGFVGVAVVVTGADVGVSGIEGYRAVALVLIVAVCYAIAPFIVATKLRDVPALGSVTLSLLLVGIGYIPAAIVTTHEVPTVRSGFAVVLLGVFCTALAFLVFFALIQEVGPVNAPLFTYINPIVALNLGVMVLAEPFGLGLVIGAPIILFGCWLAATGGRLPALRPAPEDDSGHGPG